jgi:hypothetical protein
MSTKIKATFKIVLMCDNGRTLAMNTFNSDHIPVSMDLAIDLPFDTSTEFGLLAAREIGKQLQEHIDKECIGIVKHGIGRLRAMIKHGLELPDIRD